MARVIWVVLLFAFASVMGFCSSSELRVSARGGFEFIGNDGIAAGTLVGEIKLGTKPTSDLMYVVKDNGGATKDGNQEVIILLTSVDSFSSKGNRILLQGKGTFQGEKRTIELTIDDQTGANGSDKIRIRVLRGSFVEYDHSASLASGSILVKRS